MKLINLEPKPKKSSEVNALARQRIQELLEGIEGEDIFSIALVVTTENTTNDFFIQSSNQSIYALIGAVECLKRDIMRGVESRYKYVEYDDLE